MGGEVISPRYGWCVVPKRLRSLLTEKRRNTLVFASDPSAQRLSSPSLHFQPEAKVQSQFISGVFASCLALGTRHS
ncbi:unnamed protein product [Coccothraustes coccothraustes]